MTKRAMETFDLAGRRGRERGREEVVDAVVATESVEEDLSGSESETVREDLAVVRQDLLGRAVFLEGRREVPADLA